MHKGTRKFSLFSSLDTPYHETLWNSSSPSSHAYASLCTEVHFKKRTLSTHPATLVAYYTAFPGGLRELWHIRRVKWLCCAMYRRHVRHTQGNSKVAWQAPSWNEVENSPAVLCRTLSSEFLAWCSLNRRESSTTWYTYVNLGFGQICSLHS